MGLTTLNIPEKKKEACIKRGIKFIQVWNIGFEKVFFETGTLNQQFDELKRKYELQTRLANKFYTQCAELKEMVEELKKKVDKNGKKL